MRKVTSRNREIHTFITAHCAARVITTLYDLQCELCAQLEVRSFRCKIWQAKSMFHLLAVFKKKNSVLRYPRPSRKYRNVTWTVCSAGGEIYVKMKEVHHSHFLSGKSISNFASWLFISASKIRGTPLLSSGSILHRARIWSLFRTS